MNEFAVGHSRDLGRGDKLRMEAFGQRSKCREDTLNVNNDDFAGTGQNNVFLLQEVAGHRDSVTHGDFVGSTADAADIDAFRAVFFRKREHLRILCVEYDHFGKRRVMTVYNDVDHIFFHNA